MRNEAIKTIICLIVGFAFIYALGSLAQWLYPRLEPINSLQALPTEDSVIPAEIPDSADFTELYIINKAAQRNNCHGEDLAILLAIRKAENGRTGREFGVLHIKAIDTNLDTQAGWAAATVVKNRQRWKQANQPGDFIDYLADRYCPASIDPEGNKNWKKNVKYYARMQR